MVTGRWEWGFGTIDGSAGVVSSLQDFFTGGSSGHTVGYVVNIVRRVGVHSDRVKMRGGRGYGFAALRMLGLLVLFPFFMIGGTDQCSGSSLDGLFGYSGSVFCHFVGSNGIG